MAIPSWMTPQQPSDRARPIDGREYFQAPRQNSSEPTMAASSGYVWDGIQNKYVPRYASAGSRNAISDKLMSALSGLSSAGSGAAAGGGGESPFVQFPTVGAPAPPDISGLQSAAFGQAKAKAGAMGRSAVDSLRSEMADRGVGGSGVEARGLTDRLAAATNPLSELNTAELGENYKAAQHSQDLGAQMAGEQYQGEIAQRGQDVQARTSANNLAAQRQQSQLSILSSALRGLTSGLGY